MTISLILNISEECDSAEEYITGCIYGDGNNTYTLNTSDKELMAGFMNDYVELLLFTVSDSVSGYNFQCPDKDLINTYIDTVEYFYDNVSSLAMYLTSHMSFNRNLDVNDVSHVEISLSNSIYTFLAMSASRLVESIAQRVYEHAKEKYNLDPTCVFNKVIDFTITPIELYKKNDWDQARAGLGSYYKFVIGVELDENL